jgi:TctA family transporter
MLTGLDMVWIFIWTLVLANVIAVAIFLLCAPWFGLLSFVRGGLLIPFVLLLAMLGSYLGHGAWENLVLLAGLGTLGYFLRRYGWPRPPFVIGLVLGPIAENSLHKALAIWGPTFFLRPLSLLFIALIVASVAFYVVRGRRTKRSLLYDF